MHPFGQDQVKFSGIGMLLRVTSKNTETVQNCSFVSLIIIAMNVDLTFFLILPEYVEYLVGLILFVKCYA